MAHLSRESKFENIPEVKRCNTCHRDLEDVHNVVRLNLGHRFTGRVVEAICPECRAELKKKGEQVVTTGTYLRMVQPGSEAIKPRFRRTELRPGVIELK